MSNMMGIIKLDGANSMLKELCEHRPVASLPIAGRYRVIDFAVSNMVNSGIGNVGVLLSANARSIFDHLRSGKDWDLARHRGGLSYLPSDPYDGKPATGDLQGLWIIFSTMQLSTFSLLRQTVCTIWTSALYCFSIRIPARI